MLETIASHLDSIAALAPTWGLVFIFVFMAVESSFIPFPSEVVMIPAGFLAARGELGLGSPLAALWVAIAVGVVGSLAGAYVNYYLALWVGKPFLEKYGKYLFIKPEPLARACEVFNRYGAATTFVCRLVPVIRQLISIPAGIAKMPLGAFTFFTGLGAGIWTAVLAFVGYAIGKGTGDITYLELCVKGKAMAAANLPYVIGGAVVLVALYFLASKLVMGNKRLVLVPLLLALALGASRAEAYEIDVAGDFAAADSQGLPAGWRLHEWAGFRPFADVKAEDSGECRLWNARGKAGAALRSERRFPLVRDELVRVSFEARGTGKGSACLYQWTEKGGWVTPTASQEFALTPSWRERRFVFTGCDGSSATTALASVTLAIAPGADAHFRNVRVERRLAPVRTLASDDFEKREVTRAGNPELITDNIAPGLLSPTGQGVYKTASRVALAPEAPCRFPAAAREFLTSSVRIYAFGRARRDDGRLVTVCGLDGETFAFAVEHRAAARALVCTFTGGRPLEVPYASLPADFAFSASPTGFYDLTVTSLSDSSVRTASGTSAFFRKAAGREVARSVVFESKGGEVAVDNLALAVSGHERAGKLEYPYLAKPEMEFDPVKAGWKLVFSDEFDGNAVDPAKWEMPPNKIESQRKYARVEDGRLKILADRLPGTDKLATTGFWSVPDLGYGYFEAKVKFTTYNGWWAAFWLCQSGMSNPFLDAFEIDVFEDYYMRNDARNKNDHNLHARGAGVCKSWNYNSTITRTHRDWYRIAVKWTPFEITYYLDGKAIESRASHSPYSTVTFDAFRHAACIMPLKAIVSGQIMKTAYGRHEPTPDEVYPEAYEVDYVRVWAWPGSEPGAAPEVAIDSGAKSHFSLAYGQRVDIRAAVKPAAKTGAKIRAVHLFDDGFYLATLKEPPYDFVVPMTADFFDRTSWSRPGRSGARGKFEGSTHVFCVFAEDETGTVGHSGTLEFRLAPRAKSTPYRGVAQKIPGTVVIGRYDEGGQGIAYFDDTDPHYGDIGRWRPDDAVDGGEHVIGNVSTGEWLNYTVDVGATGRYLLKFNYGTPQETRRCKVRVLVDGERTAVLSGFTRHASPHWNVDSVATAEFDLTAGRHVLTVQFSGGYNVGDMTFERMTGCTVGGANEGEVAFVDTLDLSGSSCGFGRATRAAKSVDGHPLAIAGKTYARGFGTHP